MRFKCQIGTTVQAPPRIVLLEELQQAKARRTDAGAAKRRSKRRATQRSSAPAQCTRHISRKWPVRALVASAVLAAAAGCANMESTFAQFGKDAKDTKDAKVLRVEPVFSVMHATQATQSSAAYFSLGQYYDGTQAWDKATDAYRKSIAVDANNVEAHNALGIALAQSGRYAEAELALRQAVAKAPARTYVRNNLGYVLLLGGKPTDAAVELKLAVEQDSSNPIAKANLRDAVARSRVVMSLLAEFARDGAADKLPAAVVVAASTFPFAPIADKAQAAPAIAAAAAPAPAPAVEYPAMRVGFEPTIAAIEQSKSGFSTFALVVEAVKVDSVTAPLALGAQSQAQIQVQAPAPAPASIAAVATRTPETPALAVVAATARLPASKLEISNGNGVSGMAARVGKWLATQGMSTNRLTNQQKFAQQQTVVQYRRGHEEAALRVARSLPATAKAEAAPTEGLRSDVRVVIGRDWIQTAACLDRNTCQPLATSVAGLTPR